MTFIHAANVAFIKIKNGGFIMELVTRRAVGKFCSSPKKIIRDGSGAYLYRAERQEAETYYNGKKVAAPRKNTIYHAGNYFKIKL